MNSARMSLLFWAARELRRHPGEALLMGLAIFALVALTATVLLLTQAWTATVTDLLELGPSLVVRHLDQGGWKPLPVAPAVAAAQQVVGVVEAVPRIWGIVRGPEGAVTIVGVDETQSAQLIQAGLTVPIAGEAVLGAGIADASSDAPLGSGDVLSLVGAVATAFSVRGRLDPSLSLLLHDVILLTQDDARNLLGLAPGEASDLALEVYYEAEEEAILPDLAAAFPFQVRITTKREALGAATTNLSRRGGLTTLVVIPALLAMALLITTAARTGASSRRETGLYKALGWTTTDLLYIHLYKGLAVAVPATMLGLTSAYTVVFWPGIVWPGILLMGWQTPPPQLTLNPTGAWVVLLGVAALVLAPWLLASVVPALRGALADPEDLLRGGGA